MMLTIQQMQISLLLQQCASVASPYLGSWYIILTALEHEVVCVSLSACTPGKSKLGSHWRCLFSVY